MVSRERKILSRTDIRRFLIKRRNLRIRQFANINPAAYPSVVRAEFEYLRIMTGILALLDDPTADELAWVGPLGW